MRDLCYDPKFAKLTKACKMKYRHIKKYVDKIEEDFTIVLNCLLNDKAIPEQFKDHKVGNDTLGNQIRELHLVAKGSDCLLVYKKYDATLYLYAITDHEGLNKLLNNTILLIDLNKNELTALA